MGLEAGLCFEAGGEQGGLVHIPFADTFEVFCAPFIIEDERCYFMTQALLEHEQPTEATVAIGEGTDALEAHMKVQDLRQLHLVQTLVLCDQGVHLGVYILWRRGFGLANGAAIPAVFARMKLEFTLRQGAVAEHGMQLADVGLRNSRGGCIDDVADTGDVVIRLNQIIHLDGLKACGDLTFLVDLSTWVSMSRLLAKRLEL